MQEEPFYPPFPLTALMEVMGGAAHFIHRTLQTPDDMGACAVIAACALVTQGLFDVRWREGKKSPLTLFILVDARSGERKSAVDDIAFLRTRMFNDEQVALAQEYEKEYQASLSLWKQKVKELQKLISKLSARDQDTDDQEERLEELMSDEPEKRKFPQMLVVESTGPALAQHLDSVYPYAGLITDEGITVFKSGVLRDFGMHNKLWEAGVWSSDRITRNKIVLSHCRMGMYIQSQPGVTDDFLERQGEAFHASGFSSRILYVRPKSTQGERLEEFIDIRKEIIEPYHARLTELLSLYERPTVPKQEELTLSKPASELLVWYSREVEKELGEGGRFFHMQGSASKSAENVARIAAILHVMEKKRGPISVEIMRNAIKLGAWFLNQFRIRFCPRSQLELDMIALDEFITDKVAPRFAKQKSVPGPYLCRYAPRQLRQIDRLWEALKGLEQRDKLKMWGDKGRSWYVHLADWFPPPPVVSRPVLYQPPPGSSRWEKPNHSPDLPKPDVPEDGYELWPGVYLK